MAKYNVPVTLGDGEVINVSVDADSIAEARRKALVGEETGATAGSPVLAPEPSSSSLTPTGFRERRPGESVTDYLRYRQGLPPLDSPSSPSSLTVEDLNPDLYDAGSSTYVQPQGSVYVEPENFINFVSTLENPNGLTLEELNPDLYDDQSSSYVPPVADPPPVVDPPFGGDPPVVNPVPEVEPPSGTYDPNSQAEIDRLNAINDELRMQLSNVGPNAANQGVVGDSLPFNLSDQDLFNISPDAGYQRAFSNVFGDDITSRGPLSGYFDRQRQGLTNAFRAKSLVDYLNNFQPTAAAGVAAATAPGAVGPGAFDPTAPVASPGSNPLQNQFVPQSGTFESFLRERLADPRGLNSAYANALQNYQTLRGLSASQAPESLSYLFSPTQYGDVQNAYGMLQAAQRGKYSPLVSNLFRTPSYEKAFGDYTLASQDRAKQGLGAQNFLDFAASSFGL